MVDKEIIERTEKFSKAMNELSTNGKKANVIVGGLKNYTGTSKKFSCLECGRDVYLHDLKNDFYGMTGDVCKIICPYCIVQNYSQTLNILQLSSMLDAIAYFEKGDSDETEEKKEGR